MDYYTKCLIARTEEFIGRIRWAAFHFLNPKDKISKNNPPETFGFRTNVAPPQIRELAPFEHELYDLMQTSNSAIRKVTALTKEN